MLVSASSYAATLATLPNEKWIQVAMRFAQFASLEHALLQESSDRAGVMEDCFSYGAMRHPAYESPDLNSLFSAHRESDFMRQWEDARTQALDIFTTSSHDLASHLLEVLERLNFPQFRQDVTLYLNAVLGGMPTPDLCRYPNGILDKSILRAPGMISVEHDGVPSKRRKLQA